MRLNARWAKNSRAVDACRAVATNVFSVTAAASTPDIAIAAKRSPGRTTWSRAWRATRSARPTPSMSSAASATPAKEPGGPTR
jgi:hypothetical protein